MGYELDRLMKQYGVASPTSSYVGGAAPIKPADTVSAEEMAKYNQAQADYQSNQGAHQQYKDEYLNRLQSAPMYIQHQFQTKPTPQSETAKFMSSPEGQAIGGMPQMYSNIRDWLSANPNASNSEVMSHLGPGRIDNQDLYNATNNFYGTVLKPPSYIQNSYQPPSSVPTPVNPVTPGVGATTGSSGGSSGSGGNYGGSSNGFAGDPNSYTGGLMGSILGRQDPVGVDYMGDINSSGDRSIGGFGAGYGPSDLGSFGEGTGGFGTGPNDGPSTSSGFGGVGTDTGVSGYGGGDYGGYGGGGYGGDSDGGDGGDGGDGWARGGIAKLHRKYAEGGGVDPEPYGQGLDLSRVTPQQFAMMQRQDPQALARGVARFAGQPVETPTEPTYADEMRLARQESSAAREELNNAIKAAAQQKDNAPSKAELYFNMAAAFAAPTKTGSFFESMAPVSQVLAGHKKEARESAIANQQRQQALALELAKARLSGAKDDMSNLRALTVEEMKARRLAQMPQSEVGKLAMDAGLAPGSPEYNQYVAQAAQQTSNIKEQTAATAAARAKLAETQATKLTTPELKLKEETEDALAAATSAQGALTKALELNPKTFSDSLGDMAQKYALQTVQPGHPKVVATEEQTNLLANQALSSMKSLVGGNPTEGERAIILSLQGINSKSLPVRETIIKNAISAVQNRISRNKQRLADINAGKYRETVPETPVEGAQ